MLQVCQHVVATEDDDDVPLQCLGDLATSVPKTLQPYLNQVFTLCTSVILSLFVYQFKSRKLFLVRYRSFVTQRLPVREAELNN